MIGVEYGYVAENDTERKRLDVLTVSLSEDDLQRTLDNGMTVAAALVHLAFWDDYSFALLDQWERTGFSTARSDYSVVNAALWRLASAVPRSEAPRLAQAAARRVDERVSAVPEELASTIELNSHDFALRRATHRRLHLDQIERAIAAGRG
jgi:hypothetical protein